MDRAPVVLTAVLIAFESEPERARWCRRSSVAKESLLLSAYPCPHCQTMLEPPEEPWRGWVRCPQCGQPGLPPERLQRARVKKRATALAYQVASSAGSEGQAELALASA